jgi:hypothetical protein
MDEIFKMKKNAKERQDIFGDNEEAPEYYPFFTYTVEDFKHDCVALLNDMLERYVYALSIGKNASSKFL